MTNNIAKNSMKTTNPATPLYDIEKAHHLGIVGLGKTGIALLDFFLNPLHGTGKKIFLYDDSSLINTTAAEQYRQKGVTFLSGEEQFHHLEQMDLVILSPGVDGQTPRFQKLRQKGIAVISEIEVASQYIKNPILAVTGTNGKSTTVSLLHHLLLKGGLNSFLAGNIGTPFIAEVDRLNADSVVVLELSSFQLEDIVHFKPHIALILNITPDHLDRYPDMEHYTAAKLNLAKNQDTNDYLILNKDDESLQSLAQDARLGQANRVWFSRSKFGNNTGHPGQEYKDKPKPMRF